MFRAIDLVTFTWRLEVYPNSLSSQKTLEVEISGDVRNNSLSSAKRAHLCSSWPHLTSFISEFVLMAMASDSNAIAKIKGDRGNPCLVPLLISKDSEYCPNKCTWQFSLE